MVLKENISEVAVAWRTSSSPMKIWLVLSLFLLTTQLVALLEVSIKWKGFILTGIEFYREYIRTPVASFISDYFFISFDNDFIDLISISMIMMIAYTKSFITDSRKIANTTIRGKIYDSILIGFVWGNVIHVIYLHVTNKDNPSTYITTLLVYVVLLAFFYPFNTDGRKVGLPYLIIPLLIIVTLAAINIGLS